MVSKAFKKRVFDFFEKPEGGLAQLVHVVILALIILSGVIFVIDYAYAETYSQYLEIFKWSERIILGVFTIEYLIRLWSAPKKLKFIFNFYNLIDLLAIVPGYIQIRSTTGLRTLRILRIFRVFRIFRYNKVLTAAFALRGTILEKILPVMAFFTVFKAGVFLLERNGFWLQDYNLETTFAVVGFALGIVLSQKIGVAYTKFILLEDAVTRIHGNLLSITTLLKAHTKKPKLKAIEDWLTTFHAILLRKKKKAEFYAVDAKLYESIQGLIESSPKFADLIRIYSKVNEDASFMLNRMDALTPVAYDKLLHRSTLIYSMLMVIFLPGVTGIVAVLVSSYVLYGMYQVTDEMDNAMNHLEDDLINADIEDLKRLQLG